VKYIAYFGAWGTSILCFGMTLIMMAVMACNMNGSYEPTVALLIVILTLNSLFMSVVCALVVCYMGKYMRDI
jgi:hypothetical protein